MINLYSPATGGNVATNGADGTSPENLLLNILIELRAMNAIALDMQSGLVTQTIEQYRSDAVNETVNPVI